MKNYNTDDYQSQVSRIFTKLQTKRQFNKKIIYWLKEKNENNKALLVDSCAHQIGITNINGIAKIVRGDFCRERICSICAWRRQSKFIMQMNPVIKILETKGYNFLFATLTVKNEQLENLDELIDSLMHAFSLFRKKTKIKNSWSGMVRSLELSYNEKEKTFHPHIHLLIAVTDDYFTSEEKYISQHILSEIWQNCLNVKYVPVVDIRRVNDTVGAVCETLKYALKPSYENEALSAFFYILKNRRLISFTGIFSTLRKELKLSSYDEILTDDINSKKTNITFDLYRFDVTGGVYKFYNTYFLKGD